MHDYLTLFRRHLTGQVECQKIWGGRVITVMPVIFCRSVNPIPTKGGRFCPPFTNYRHPPKVSPSGITIRCGVSTCTFGARLIFTKKSNIAKKIYWYIYFFFHLNIHSVVKNWASLNFSKNTNNKSCAKELISCMKT